MERWEMPTEAVQADCRAQIGCESMNRRITTARQRPPPDRSGRVVERPFGKG